MNKRQQLEELKKKVQEDKSLPLGNQATQLVFGKGNPDSRTKKGNGNPDVSPSGSSSKQYHFKPTEGRL
ncbi:MAG: hypothetical protein UU73_C0001G0358 [Candidatus Daviesbacteria bacterium GW2011_GWA1_41_61]|uniref:Uncharacterized protein n=1 Tax=Candidatus Daviesbacteria bacterium GW2011_GWA2_40_9 TaxID=1618424 RepID=A0A0G0TZY1_9BACT|nr:MAG: hypothetical protein UU26_C0016G0026 [Candidatus Daviesbacteria bacterium GW2011_GWC1_40_9]KKR82464.1 MAG: hypothetical protein UU29_C0012G0002 [Candidatus Daviesbacteria bacterium GW2011_GWA2_40_9]KKR93177.1 MAG: hypothetical protein UU44_C0004G0359 [Candidatus Daviesbacteria bacterium GW2011_GWB1_41_15]KKS15721.1 MAG: hypothetical protein UU73_C0001G0358 [Candidatus Daviesbacteria bacterium GW2011_GWA1_41_61]